MMPRQHLKIFKDEKPAHQIFTSIGFHLKPLFCCGLSCETVIIIGALDFPTFRFIGLNF